MRERKKKSVCVCSAVLAVKSMLLIKRRNLNYHPGNPCFICVIHAEETGAKTAENKTGLQTGSSGVKVREFLEV